MCLVRIHTIPSLECQPFLVIWVILNAEARFIARRRIRPPTSFFQRKTAVYHTLNDALGDPTRRYFDETTVGLAAASVIETRSSNPTVVLIHIKCYDKVRRDVIKQRSESSQSH